MNHHPEAYKNGAQATPNDVPWRPGDELGRVECDFKCWMYGKRSCKYVVMQEKTIKYEQNDHDRKLGRGMRNERKACLNIISSELRRVFAATQPFRVISAVGSFRVISAFEVDMSEGDSL
jgi:hypothetical protein